MPAPEPSGATDPASAGLVSVVVCFLDAEPFLAEAVASVYAQSYGQWELLLVDDGSSDESTAIAQRHAAADPARVRYLEHPGHENRGVSASRNLGIAQARGELVALLDADDVWLPRRLERGVQLLREHPSADMAYGESEYWRSWEGRRARHADRVQPHGFRADRVLRAPELLLRYLTHAASLPCPSALTVRRRALLDCGGFVDAFRGMYEDQVFLARFCLHHDVYVANECWDRYRQHSDSLCAEAARSSHASEARQAYLGWLRSFLEEEGMQGTPAWDALCYSEAAARHAGRGWYARLRRIGLRALTRARMALRAGSRAPAVRSAGGSAKE